MKSYLTFFIFAVCFLNIKSTFLREAAASLESEMESHNSNELVKGLNEINKLKQTIVDLVFKF